MSKNTRKRYLDLLSSHREELRTFGVTRIGLFGSTARGEAKPDSDVDILVDFEPSKKSYDALLDVSDYVEGLFDWYRVDVVTTKAISKYILPYVLREVEQIEVR